MTIKTATILVLAYDKFNILRALTQRRSSKEYTGTSKVEIPGGHVDLTDKTPKHGVVRELLEETGLKVNVNNVRQLFKDKNHGVYFIILKKKCKDIIIPGSIKNHNEISKKPPKFGISFNNSDNRYKWYNLFDFRIDSDLWHYTKNTVDFANKKKLFK